MEWGFKIYSTYLMAYLCTNLEYMKNILNYKLLNLQFNKWVMNRYFCNTQISG